MPYSKEEIKQSYPLPVYNYRVEIGTDAMSFSEASGMSIARETITYKESQVDQKVGPILMQMPGQQTPPTITLKRGIVRNKERLLELYDWINEIDNNLVDKKDIFIRLCDEAGKVVISWKVHNAFPTKLDAPSFTADSNEAAIESMELTGDKVSIE